MPVIRIGQSSKAASTVAESVHESQGISAMQAPEVPVVSEPDMQESTAFLAQQEPAQVVCIEICPLTIATPTYGTTSPDKVRLRDQHPLAVRHLWIWANPHVSPA